MCRWYEFAFGFAFAFGFLLTMAPVLADAFDVADGGMARRVRQRTCHGRRRRGGERAPAAGAVLNGERGAAAATGADNRIVG